MGLRDAAPVAFGLLRSDGLRSILSVGTRSSADYSSQAWRRKASGDAWVILERKDIIAVRVGAGYGGEETWGEGSSIALQRNQRAG